MDPQAPSQLHMVLRKQFSGRISADRAIPAVFLLAHDAFDANALRAAADIYDKADPPAGIAQCLRSEAALREAAAARRPAPFWPPSSPSGWNEDWSAFLSELSKQVGLCARIGGAQFNEGVRAAQKEIEAVIIRMRQGGERAR